MDTGTGTQVVPVPFEAKALMFFGLGTLNTLMYGDGGFRDAAMIGTGFADGTIDMGQSSSDAAGFGARFVCGGSSGAYSVIAVHTQAAFGGNMVLQAAVSSISSTGFTIAYTTNDTSGGSTSYPYFAPGQSFMFVALGGADLDVDMGIPTGSGLPTTIGFPLKGLISRGQTLGPGGGTATGAGGGGAGAVGWTTDAGEQGCVATYLAGYTTMYAYHATDRVTADLTSGGAVSSGQIGTITATAFTASNYAGSYLAVGGTNIITKAGAFTQSAATGAQVVSLGIDAAVVLFATAGTLTSDVGVVQEGSFQFNLGALTADGTVASLWCGEINTSSAAPLGARYVSDAALLRFGTPNGASTTFDSVVDSATLSPAGTATLNWASTDAGNRAVLWFAIGSDVPGSLTVRKVVTGPSEYAATPFAFTTTGGLTPSTFSLANGDTQVFADIPVGTYGVTETPVADWTIDYTVSNADAHDAIDVGAGEDVTVIVRNTYSGELPATEPWKLYRMDIKPRKETKS